MPSQTGGHDPRIKTSVSRHWPICWVEVLVDESCSPFACLAYIIIVYHVCSIIQVLGVVIRAACQAHGMLRYTVMRPAAIVFTFRFSSRRHSLAPLTITLRKPTAATYSPWGSVSKRIFSHSAFRQNSSSGPEASRHSKSDAQPCLRENEVRCECSQQWKVLNMGKDQGSRSPLLDATLTALMGIGIGELQF